MTNMERISRDLHRLGLCVKSVDEQAASPVGVEFHTESDFDNILLTLRTNGYKVIRYVDVSWYVVLMPPAA